MTFKFYFTFGVILNNNYKQYAVFLTLSCYVILCNRQKRVNTLILFKRDAGGLYHDGK